MVQSTSSSATEFAVAQPRLFETMSNEIRPRRLVCLTGFMGAAANQPPRACWPAGFPGWMHTDLDRCISHAVGLTISEIFARAGEAEFRRLESEQLARITAEYGQTRKPRILSPGGGTITQPQNLTLLREQGAALIWLRCPIEELLKALRPDYRPSVVSRRSELPQALQRASADLRTRGLPGG